MQSVHIKTSITTDSNNLKSTLYPPKFYVAVADVAGRGVDTGADDAMTAEGSSTLRGFLMRFHSPVL